MPEEVVIVQSREQWRGKLLAGLFLVIVVPLCYFIINPAIEKSAPRIPANATEVATFTTPVQLTCIDTCAWHDGSLLGGRAHFLRAGESIYVLALYNFGAAGDINPQMTVGFTPDPHGSQIAGWTDLTYGESFQERFHGAAPLVRRAHNQAIAARR
jgi:hypothetical protein